MPKKPFFPNDSPGQMEWLNNFADALPGYAVKYGITTAQLDATEADRLWMNHWYTLHTQVQMAAQAMTAFKNEVAFGVPAGSEPSVEPSLPDSGTPPAAVEPGVFPRALSIANAIKKHKDYTIADGEGMGLEGAEVTPPDLAEARPVLKPKVAADHVDVGWSKQGLPVQAVEIWVKRGSGAFAYLATDTTTPVYADTQPFPAEEEKWTYKAIFITGGGRVGLWSEEVTVTVKA